MIGKKINQLATELAPASTDLTIIGNPTTGVSKKITLAQLGAIFSGAVSFYTNLASFPATGTLDVIFCAKDTQKLYLWSGSAYVEVFPSQALLDTYQLRSEKGNANGYASLDSSGKVPISQLPSSIMEYKGTWSAATNTPTLANGTGDTGDVYLCNAAGSVNFGAGAITFAIGDYVVYSGSIWQRSSGAVGTVTSVAASITGNAIGITGSPITTSGTLVLAFAGTSAQYVNGAGNLTTFPSIVSQAQNIVSEVYNNSGATLTKGTIVYINGGQGNLPTVTKALATGDSTSAQTYGIVQADITNMNNGYVVVAGRLIDLDTQAYSNGTQLYLSGTTAGTWTSTKPYAPIHLVYVGIVVRSHPTQGVVEVKIQNGYELDEIHNVSAQTPTNNDGLFYESSTSLWKNKSISTILGGTPVIGSGTTNFVSKFTASSTIGSSQIWDNGTSVLIGTTGTLPGVKVGIYSSTQRALEIVSTNSNALFVQSPAAYILTITNGTWTSQFTNTGRLDLAGDLLLNTIANATTDTDKFLVSDSGVIKYRTGAELLSDIGAQPSGSYVTSVNTLTGAVTLTTTNIAEGTNLYYTEARVNANTNVAANTAARHNAVTIGTANGLSLSTQVLSLALASGSTTGALSSTDWTTFNNKQSALTNPVTGTGTTNYLPKFTGTGTIGNSLVYDNGSGIGINTSSISAVLDVNTAGSSIRFGDKATVSNDINVYYRTTGIARNDIGGGGTFTWGISDGSENMRLNASGNLSIGNTNDTYKLDVSGTARINGSALFNGNSEINVNHNSLTRLLVRNTTAGTGAYVETSYQVDSTGGAGAVGKYSSGTNAYKIIPASTTYLYNSGAGDIAILNDFSSGAIKLAAGGSTSAHLTIASTGAATFSSSVTATNMNVFGTTELAYVNGVTQMRISRSGSVARIQNYDGGSVANIALNWEGGNVGIGTTSPVSNANRSTLALQGAWGGQLDIMVGSTVHAQFGTDNFNSGLSCRIQSQDGIVFNAGGATERMRITSGGNVLINGTTVQNSATSRGNLTINGTTSILNLSISDTNAGYLFHSGTDLLLVNAKNGAQLFYTNDTERMRITSAGNLLVGATSTTGLEKSVTTNGTSNSGFIMQTGGVNRGYLYTSGGSTVFLETASGSISLVPNSGSVIVSNLGTGLVYSNGGALTSTNPSDQRLKNNIQSISYGLNEILKLNPVTFDWKEDKINQGKQYGFIAQEVQKIMPDLVKNLGIKDYLGLDKEAIFTILVRAIQELNDKIK